VIDYTLEHNEDFGTMRDIGASMPVTVFNLPNFIAFFNDYLSKVRHASPQTVLSAVRHLKAIIYFTQEQGWVDKYNIKIKELKPEIKSTFTADEIYRMGKKPKITEDNFVEYRTWVMIRYLSATGNRVSSMLALNVNDINFEDDTIRINTTKNNNPKLMPLPYELKKDLLQYIYKSRTDKDGNILYREPLFSTMWGERLTYDGARAAFMDYFEARKIRWEGFHKFRHSYAANWIKDGGNPFMLKEYLGHSSLAMTNRYANIYGMATRKEAEEHSLINKFPKRHNNKKIRNKV
ncbi:MAG: site-specific integrase, partial [Campylobacter sp.]|uniref:tyrosine-type recombinase/integrase n=1 Tax=Campylobacter sp. TaxID=205 RepID=UPI001B2D2AC1